MLWRDYERKYIMENGTIDISLHNIDCIVLRPDHTEPGITYCLSDNTHFVQVFADEADCDASWDELLRGLGNKGFVRYHGLYLRATQLRLLEKLHSEEHGHHLKLTFFSDFQYCQCYEDEETLDGEHEILSGILSALQDEVSTPTPPATIQ